MNAEAYPTRKLLHKIPVQMLKGDYNPTPKGYRLAMLLTVINILERKLNSMDTEVRHARVFTYAFIMSAQNPAHTSGHC